MNHHPALSLDDGQGNSHGSTAQDGTSSVAFFVTSPESASVLLLPVIERMASPSRRIHLVVGSPGVHRDLLDLCASTTVVPMSRAIAPLEDFLAVFRSYRTLKRLRPDVVVGATPKAAAVSMLAAFVARVPRRVFHVWGARWESLSGWRRALLRAADNVAARLSTDCLVASPSLGTLLTSAGVSESWHVLEYPGTKGVDRTVFRPRTGLCFDRHAPRIGFVGRLSPDKGIDVLLNVVAALRVGRPGLQLEILGAVDSAHPINDDLASQITSLSYVTWNGALPPGSVASHMAEWDLLLFPSLREGLPNAVIEAAACGVPTVAWRCTGVVDAVADGYSGLLAEAGDLQELLAAAEWILDERVHDIARANCLKWAQNFDSDLVVATFIDYLEGSSHAIAGRADEVRALARRSVAIAALRPIREPL